MENLETKSLPFWGQTAGDYLKWTRGFSYEQKGLIMEKISLFLMGDAFNSKDSAVEKRFEDNKEYLLAIKKAAINKTQKAKTSAEARWKKDVSNNSFQDEPIDTTGPIIKDPLLDRQFEEWYNKYPKTKDDKKGYAIKTFLTNINKLYTFYELLEYTDNYIEVLKFENKKACYSPIFLQTEYINYKKKAYRMADYLDNSYWDEKLGRVVSKIQIEEIPNNKTNTIIYEDPDDVVFD